MPIAILSLGNTQCGDKPAGAPDFGWTPRIYSPDSKTRQLVRGSTKIRCEDPKFDLVLCMPASDVGAAQDAYYKVLNQCAKWK